MFTSAATGITPVTLLTGFLGSGKTTLLNHILNSPGVPETAVLINEFGAAPIDHLLVRKSSDSISVMNNGCVCCSVAGDMVSALRELYFKRSKGEIPNFTRVIIETTGLADPAPIMHTLLEMPVIAARYVLSGVVTTVDTTHGDEQLDLHPESVKQVAVADRIILTKIDLVNGKRQTPLNALRARIARLNPGASMIDAVNGRVSFQHLFDNGLYRADAKAPDVAKWLNAEAYRSVRGTGLGMSGRVVAATRDKSASRHDASISSISLQYDVPVDWYQLVNAIEMLQSTRGDQLLRVKGIVNVAGEPRPRVIHAVQHTLYPSASLAAWPDDNHSTRLVFIVKNLDTQFIVDSLDQFLLHHATPLPPA
jgi:G3E family GTPase